jgi:hypothetical protein
LKEAKRNLILIFILSFPVFGKEKLNSMESELFRFSSIRETQNHFIPWRRETPESIKELGYNWFFDAFLFGNSSLKNAYEDFSSDNEDEILERINQSYGKPLTTIARLGVQYKNKDFKQGLYANGGEVFLLNNPVFPELHGVLLIDFSSITEYSWYSSNDKFRFTPSLAISRRKSLKKTLSFSEIILDKSSYKLSQTNWYNTVDASLESEYSFSHFSLMASARSVPIYGQKYNYWDTIVGFKTTNLAKKMDSRFLADLNFFGHYSPFYGGRYDVKKNYSLGTGIGFSDHLLLDLFISGKFYVNAGVKLNLENFEISIYTKKDSYDDFFIQEARFVGINSRFQF